MFLIQAAEYMFPHSKSRSTLQVHNSFYDIVLSFKKWQSHHVTGVTVTLERGVLPVVINSYQLVL